MNRSLFSCALLAAAGIAQVPAPAGSDRLPAAAPVRVDAWPFDHVLHDAPGDGRLWAAGSTWKASFGREGFTYVPALPGAPRNFPVQLRLAGVRVGGQAVPLHTNVMPVRDGDRIVFDRGAVQEVYDLRVAEVEQTFVVDTALAGDVDVDIAVVSELGEDPTRPGIQFANTFGEVRYGDAFLVRDGDKLAIDSWHAGSTIRLRAPAALRGDGPVIIDPILSTAPVTTSAGALTSPDVAYDATNERYLMVWESVFSELDHDVFTLMLDAQGNPIPGSGAPVDITSTYVEHPRVANSNQADRFLVVVAILNASSGQQWIFGRTRDAFGAMAMQPAVLFSDASTGGSNYLCEVGGDPGTGPGDHDWLVVWANSLSGTTARIQGRIVKNDGQPRTLSVIPIQSVQDQRNWDVQVSRSNGNGVVTQPMWWVVYGRSTPQTAGDIHGRSVDCNGVVGTEQPFETSASDDKRPHVSSPAMLPDRTGFMLTWERTGSAMGRVLRHDPNGWLVFQTWDLGWSFGAARHLPRVDSDGLRFAFTSTAAINNTSLEGLNHARTFAYDGSDLAQQGPSQGLPGFTSQTRIVALAASGGTTGRYGIAYLKYESGFQRPMFTRFAGQSAGEETNVLPTACGSATIAVTGSTALGSTLSFTLSNYGNDIPAFGFGGANVNAVPICPTCSLGLRLDLPILVIPGAAVSIAIPPALALIGETYAMQGLAVGSGTCFGSLLFTDTVRFTIR